jgi:hypothetical protein
VGAAFAAQMSVRQAAKLIVNNRDQLLERRLASLSPREQQPGDIVWREPVALGIVH